MEALLVMCLVGAASASAGIDDSTNGWESTFRKPELKFKDVYPKDYSNADEFVRVKQQVRSQTNANL